MAAGQPLIARMSRAPRFRLAELEGGERTLDELHAGGPLLLAFFKLSCPVCQMTLPYLDRLAVAGLRVYGISQDDARATLDFRRRFGIRLPMLLDSEDGGFAASNAYGIARVPTLFWIEADQTVGRIIEGWHRKEIEWVAEQAGLALLHPGENVPEWKAG